MRFGLRPKRKRAEDIPDPFRRHRANDGGEPCRDGSPLRQGSHSPYVIHPGSPVNPLFGGPKVNKAQVELRKQRGREIAARLRIVRQEDGSWRVPSSESGSKFYVVNVDPTNVSCTCRDHERTGQRCKHIFGVEALIEEEQTKSGSLVAVEPMRPRKPTYRQKSWSAFNASQRREEEEFLPLLYDLCATIPEPEHRRGRRPVPIRDAVFAAIYKVYLTRSARRVIPAMNLAYERGMLERPVAFTTLWNTLERAETSDILHNLIIKCSLPLASVESIFAVDSTGFVGNRFVRWCDIKYRGITERVWAKAHFMCGVKTRIITDVVIEDRDASDLGQLPILLNTTVQNFTVKEVLADKVYNTVHNQNTIAAAGAEAFIPFKSNHSGRQGGLWKKAFLRYQENREDFLLHYHQRSHIETAIAQIKTKFGDGVRSKTETAMKNEVFAKTICHNICVLIRGLYEDGLAVEFFPKKEEAAD
jgi:transposase